MKKMWEIKQAASDDILELYIYGDVEGDGYDWWTDQTIESETSANHFREELAKHPNVKEIKIYINSYGGSVFEGTAIYNQLRRHPAEKTVLIDGFACSIASVIAMAGKVIMPRNAMMMIHNAWIFAMGNSTELRKAADDLDQINKGNRQAYILKAGDKLPEEQLIKMLNEETWLTAEECIAYGLADEYAEADADMTKATEILQKANMKLEQRIKIQKSLAAQLRELTKPPAPPKQNEPQNQEPSEDPSGLAGEPKQKKPINFLNALLGGKE